MKYTDDGFDMLLTESLTLAIKEDWQDVLQFETANPSESLHKRIQLITEKQKHRKPHMRLVASVAIVLSILAGALALSPSARAFVQKIFYSWFSDHAEYHTTDRDTITDPENYQINYIPEGYTLTEKQGLPNLTAYYVYVNEDGQELIINVITGKASMNIDNEHNKFYQTVVDGQLIDIYETTVEEWSSSAITFYERENIFISVDGHLPVDELIQIITQIK